MIIVHKPLPYKHYANATPLLEEKKKNKKTLFSAEVEDKEFQLHVPFVVSVNQFHQPVVSHLIKGTVTFERLGINFKGSMPSSSTNQY